MYSSSNIERILESLLLQGVSPRVHKFTMKVIFGENSKFLSIFGLLKSFNQFRKVPLVLIILHTKFKGNIKGFLAKTKI